MKLCIDCKYCKNKVWCTSPSNGISLVDGEPISKFCTISRNDWTGCNTNGKLFEPITVTKKKVWWKFWIT